MSARDRRRAWLHRYLTWARTAGAPIPAYGSGPWLRLPDEHPHKLGAALVAAEAWVSTGDDIPLLLRVEIEQARADEEFRSAVEHAAFRKVAAFVRAMGGSDNSVWGPTQTELQRRRGRTPTVTTPPLSASPADQHQDPP